MSLADYRSQLPHHFTTEDTQALGPGASKGNIKAGQRDQKLPIGEARLEEKRAHDQRSSSSSSSRTSTSIGDISTPVRKENKSTTKDICARPSKGFVDIVAYFKIHVYLSKLFLTEEFLSLKDTHLGSDPSRFEDYAVVLRRTCEEQSRTGRSLVVRMDLEIHSEPLCIRFREIAAKSYMDTNLQAFPITLQSPFFELFFYREEIRALANNTDIDADLRRDAQALDEFVHLPNGPLAPIIQDHEKFGKEGKVINEIIWTIYPPNSLLIYDTGVVKECYICRNMALERSETGEKVWVVTGLRIGFDGQFPVLVRQQFSLPSRGSELIEIGKLPLQPLGVYSARKTLERLFEKRAERITTGLGTHFRSFVCCNYSGSAWDGDRTNPRDRSPRRVITERLMVDFIEPYKSLTFHPVNIENINRSSKSMGGKSGQGRSTRRYPPMPPARLASPARRDRNRRMERDGWVSRNLDSGNESSQDDVENTLTYDRAENTPEPSSHFQVNDRSVHGLAETSANMFNITVKEFGFLFPALVPAFGLSSRKWWWVLSDELQDVNWDDAGLGPLQHDQNTKNLVQKLIEGQKRMHAACDDAVPGKERGLVFLLHGSQHVGKGYTAERIAECLERPLYPIMSQDLSGDTGILNSRLSRFLYRAERWNAVALLERADVLSSNTASGDMVKKSPGTSRALVRAIEDFQGILIMTAAERKDISEDIKSLVHLTIRYPALSSDAQARIWENLIKDIKTPTDESWNEAVYGELGKLNLNGHMIKNFLRTAVAFANAEEKPLGARHVLTILRTELSAEDFEDDKETWEKQVQPALHRLHEMLDIPFQQG